MSLMLTIPAGERQVLRVFALDLPREQALELIGQPDVLAGLLGVAVDPAGIEVFDVADLAGVGLVTYLIEGDGAAEAQIAADRARLAALSGFVMIVRSQAFAGHAAELRLDACLTPIGRYGEDVPVVQFEPLPNAAAVGLTGQGKPAMSDARIGGMVATAVLVLMFVFVAVFVWMAR